MSATNDRLLDAGAAIGDVLHNKFSDLTQAERVFVLQMSMQQELNPPDDGMTFEEFEKVFEEIKEVGVTK